MTRQYALEILDQVEVIGDSDSFSYRVTELWWCLVMPWHFFQTQCSMMITNKLKRNFRTNTFLDISYLIKQTPLSLLSVKCSDKCSMHNWSKWNITTNDSLPPFKTNSKVNLFQNTNCVIISFTSYLYDNPLKKGFKRSLEATFVTEITSFI